jgi:hypothetical protein
MAERALTSKQRAFIAAYVGEARGVGAAAARMAGYKGNNHALAVEAQRLLDTPRVKQALDVFRMATARKATKSAEDIAEWLCQVMDGEITEPQQEGGEGPPRMKDRLTACGHYIKIRGLDRPAPVVEGQDAPTVSPDMERALIRLAQLTPEQWAAFQAGVTS